MAHELADYFWSGGTLSARAPSYIERAVDRELVEVLASGEYAYVLDTRQIGKSSLVIRTREILKTKGIRVALIDLTRAGTNLSPAQWYMSLLARVDESLGMGRACVQAYTAEPERPPMERFFEVLETVALSAEVTPLVVVVDEIDVVLSLPFSADEFFAGIRECFVRRSVEPELNRLSFCLVGSASPASLIRDVRITPFNIGVRILPTDFALEELTPYAQALSSSGRDGDALVRRVHYWTNGHPYLTQLLCGEIARDGAVRSARDVDQLVDRLFLSPSATEADHLALISRRILESPEGQADRGALLDVLIQVERKPMRDDPADANMTVLKLAGVVRASGGQLTIRNRLYGRYFGRRWIEENMPGAELVRRQKAVRAAQLRIGGIASVVALALGSLALFSFVKAREAELANRAALTAKGASDHLLYEANMDLVQTAFENNQFGRVQELLDEAAKPLFAAFRGPEWGYWDYRMNTQLFTLKRHKGKVVSASFSPDGTRIVTASDDNTARVWDASDGHEMAALKGHTEGLSDASFSSDGTRVVTASFDNTARVWDAKDGREIAALKGHSDRVTKASFSPDGTRVVTASFDKTARLWDSTNGRAIAVLSGHTREVFEAWFSPDGTRVVTVGWEKIARIWNAKDGRNIAVLKGHAFSGETAQFSPDGTRLVTGSWDKTARVWDARNGRTIAVLKGHAGAVNSCFFSPDGKRVVTASNDNTVRIWGANDGRELVVLKGHTDQAFCASFSPDGARIVTASKDNTARLWDARDGRQLAALNGHTAGVNSCSFSPDGLRIVTASGDNTARVWDARDGRLESALKGHTYGVTSASFSADGTRIVTASFDHTARIWYAKAGREIAVLVGHSNRVNSASFSLDGTKIVSASNDKTARIWDAQNGLGIATLKGHTDYVVSASFSTAGQRVVTASFDGSARVWSGRDGNEIFVLQEHAELMSSASFSSDNKHIVICADGLVRIWDANGGGEIAAPKGQRPAALGASFSPDGTRILTAEWMNMTARIWDAQRGRVLATCKGHTGLVNSALYSADGGRIVTASDDGTVRVWDANDGRQLLALDDQGAEVKSASFSGNASYLVLAVGREGRVVPLSRAAAAELTFVRQEAWVGDQLLASAKAGDSFAWRWQMSHWFAKLDPKNADVQRAIGSATGSKNAQIAADARTHLIGTSGQHPTLPAQARGGSH